MKIEHDMVQVISGVRFGRTIGSPVAMLVANRDWANWTDRWPPSASRRSIWFGR